jgi:hypothetical protein
LTAEGKLLIHLNGALFSLAALHDLVAELGGSEHYRRFTGDIRQLETTAYHLILEVERCGVSDGQ